MADWDKFLPGQRNTWLYHQIPGKRNAVYPWVIMQDANGATVKLSDEQMEGVVAAYLNEKEKNAKEEETNPV